MVKLSRSASASVLKNKLSIYRDNDFARASLEKRVSLIKSFAKFDDNGNRIDRRPQTADDSTILQRNKSAISSFSETKSKQNEILLSHRNHLKNSFEVNKKRIMKEQEDQRLATLAKIEEKSVLSKPRAISSQKHGFFARYIKFIFTFIIFSWFQLLVILKATRNMSEVYTSNKKIVYTIFNIISIL